MCCPPKEHYKLQKLLTGDVRMIKKKLIPCMYLYSGKAVAGFREHNDFECKDVKELASFYSDNGADGILVFDLSRGDAQHEESINKLKEIADTAEVPIISAGNIKRAEDVKKILYAGCEKAILNFGKQSNVDLIEEVSKRFGKEKIAVCVAALDEYTNNRDLIEEYASLILCLNEIYEDIAKNSALEILVHTTAETQDAVFSQLKSNAVSAVSGTFISDLTIVLMDVKAACKKENIGVYTLESRIDWSEFKLNSDQMLPVIVQDYKTDEVLMLAYMNEKSFKVTLEIGKMTYWSRSRNELWTKGLTSGHVQYVKSLSLDCDNDTILAKVSQVGAACHTGNRTCFFKEIVRKDYKESNPLKVFQNVYNVILDRKENPKEGSYTNYLFDKGIDKILKKVGEECTEIVIAAKNPEKEEIKYEISDFLYHVMVLMAEKGVSWEDITKELAHRS